MDVFVYVVHLLGSGHLRRAVLLANSMAARGLSVCLVSGGMPLPNLGLRDDIVLVQLPGVRARDGNFSDLVDHRGVAIDQRWRQRRRGLLCHVWRRYRARILLIESYPFARRQMRHELLPLLKIARQARVVCSIRDILQPRRNPARTRETVQLVNRYFSDVLVHGDQRLAALQRTFDAVEQLQVPITYTGYVDKTTALEPSAMSFDVVVAAGGGAVGAAVYRAAIEAARMDANLSWLCLVGHALNDARWRQLQSGVPDNLTLQRNRPDYRAVLMSAGVSVSQAGYNTVVDCLNARCRAVLIPYSAGGELEQTLRAELFARHGFGVVLKESALTAERLFAAVQHAQSLQPAQIAIDTNGTATVARLICEWLGKS